MKPLFTLGPALGIAFALRAYLQRKRFDFTGKPVLITGGGRGLGLALARELAARGATLALCSRSQIELDAARHELEAAGTRVTTRVCDVRDNAAVQATIAAFERDLGPLEVVINDVGIIETGPIDALVLDDYRNAIDTNLFGAIHVVEAVRAGMTARRRGRIVNITSIGGKIVVPHLLPYCTSKFALVAYSEGLRAELKRYGIVVTTIVPGLMRTGSPPQATFAGQPAKEYALFAPSDSLPFTSVSVEHAARAIADATERGEIERVISWQAKAAMRLYGVAPRLTARIMAAVARVLPDAGGSTEHRKGAQSESPLTAAPSPLTAASRNATGKHNELLDPGV